MNLIVFFTNPDSLSDIGVLLPWDEDQELHQFRIVADHDNPEQQIWIVRDEIRYAWLRKRLGALQDLEEMYYVYHSQPLTDTFLKPLKAYLDRRGICSKCRKAQHTANTETIFEELVRQQPYAHADFKRIVQRIQPDKAYIYRMLNKMQDMRKVLEQPISPADYPGWVRNIYSGVMSAVSPENFEEKKLTLKNELEKYCQGNTSGLIPIS